MKSRAELLAEIEENRLQNQSLQPKADELRVLEGDREAGYDPYDCTGRRAVKGQQGSPATPRRR